jgi:hypothetical protein
VSGRTAGLARLDGALETMMDNRIAGRLYRRIIHKYFLSDVMYELRVAARKEAAEFIGQNLRSAMLFQDRMALLDFAISTAKKTLPNGLVCEFGVSSGKTMRIIAQTWGGPVHGFDSFEGLPEDWTGTYERAGRFNLKGQLPKVPANVTLHAGWFDKSLPRFLDKHPGPAALLHLDADIYSSTKTALDLMKPRIVPGTVLLFDEYTNYPNWREHEHKAWQEFLAETGFKAEFIGFSTLQGQAAAQIRAIA